MTNDARDAGPNARRRSLALRPAPARLRALAALGLLGAACGPLLGIDEVEGVSGAAGAGGLAAGQAGAPARGSAGAGGAPAGAGGSGATGGGGDGGDGGDGGGGPMGPLGFLRFVNLRPPMVVDPANLRLDFCVRRLGEGEWQGPILERLGLGGLAFEQASGYGPLPPGEYEGVALPAAVGNCENAELQVSVRPLLIEQGRAVTLAVTGTSDTPQLVPYPEGPPPPPGDVAIVVAHAAPDVTVIVSPNEGASAVIMNLHDFARVPAPMGGWPIAGFNVADVTYAPAPEPGLPNNFYSAFLLPAPPQQEVPIGLLLCENNPPRMPGADEPGNVNCERFPLEPSPLPPPPPFRPVAAR